MTKIEIDRRFAPTDEKQLSDPDYLSFFGEKPEGVREWSELLSTSPVVILGEGRSGKTYEFLRQVKKLRAEQKFAFFLPLERLYDEDFEDALEVEDLQLFQRWQKSPDDEGYFFLDALDELKLREGSMRKAIKKLQVAISGHIGRASIILSCRPADWKSTTDRPYLIDFCQPKNQNVQKQSDDAEALFLEIISKDESVISDKIPCDESATINRTQIQLVSILPLSQTEVREFSDKYAPQHAQEFCKHLESNNLWHLYRLPAEIMDALNQIQSGQPLGSLEDQISFGIEYKLNEVEKNKRQQLSLEKAREGAQRIALALFLLKCRSIKVEATNNPETLDVQDVLIDWTKPEQEELIGKSLFDPSGVGAVRFHHRSTQEYLAAKRLQRLYEDGLPFNEFCELLFSEVGGEKVVRPSMAPVAAWLSLWLPEVRKIVVEREPELLFRQGMPSALPLDFKAEILTAYVKRYASKDWCRTGVDRDNLKRVADRRLEPTIRCLWTEGYAGHDSREILLDFIWAGEIAECADLALIGALDNSIGPSHQTYGAWGVIAAGMDVQQKALADAVINRQLSQRVIRNISPELVPKFIDMVTFSALVDTLDEIPRSVHGLNYTIFKIAANPEISRQDLVYLRDHLSDAIWKSRRKDCKMFRAHSSYDHYQDGLIAACAATIPICGEDPTDWACAVAIAMHFGERRETIIAKKHFEEIGVTFKNESRLREAYFWACLAMADELEGQEGNWPRFIRAISEFRRTTYFCAEDHDWLLREVSVQSVHNERGVAFEAIKYFIKLADEPEFTKKLKKCVDDNNQWLTEIDQILNPTPRKPDKYEREMRERDKKHKKEEEKRVKQWQEWRKEVLSDSDFQLSGEKRVGTLYDVRKVIEQAAPRDSSWGHWNSAVIRKTFNEDFLGKLRGELSKFWRETKVLLPSERNSDERHTIYNSWLLALTAVKAEAELSGWAEQLNDQEATQATRIACIELNGFGSFVTELDTAHPEIVARVISEEGIAQLSQFSETSRADIFHDIFYHGTCGMKSALAEETASILGDTKAVDLAKLSEVLSYAIRIISSHGSDEAKQIAIHYLSANNSWPAGKKIHLLSTIEPELACNMLLDVTKDLSDASKREKAVSIFAEVFGDRHSRQIPELTNIPIEKRIPLVRDLVIRAYQAVRRDEDISHDGCYTPSLRDNAQDARSFLFDTLLEVKKPEVLAILHQLASSPEFSHMPDRLRQMAYEIAAQISDAEPYPLASFRKLDRDGAFVPYDNRSLFAAMISRLDAFEHDILHAEDRPIAALRKVDQETDLRPFLANWLRGRDRGVFDFTQEAVVADEKRTDLRFHPKSMSGYGTVELKRETWTVAELESALKDQLVGQYLKHENCQVGCLLICQREKKRWQNPEGGAMLNLRQVVERLKALAVKITSDQPELHLTVKGIDYS